MYHDISIALNKELFLKTTLKKLHCYFNEHVLFQLQKPIVYCI